MTSKERLLGALRGEKTDRIPWSPFLAYWWEQNLTPEREAMGQIAFVRAIGGDPLLRGSRGMFKTRYGKTKITESVTGTQKRVLYETPVGELNAVYDYSDAGDTWFLTGHPVKVDGDFRVLAYIAEDTILEPDYEHFTAEQEKKPDALFMPTVCPQGKTAFQSMIEFWVGTEEMSYFEADSPGVLKTALDAMGRSSMEAAKISAASAAEVFISWEDTSTTNISPAWYERYILPEINGWCGILHGSGKLYVQHACGHLRHLMPLIASSEIDAVESLSERPTGNISMVEFSRHMPDRIAIISGIEPTFFMNSTTEALEEHIDLMCDHFKDRRFILANADSCPPSVPVEKFGIVTKRLYAYFGLEAPPIRRFEI
jgi:hypothetical protein